MLRSLLATAAIAVALIVVLLGASTSGADPVLVCIDPGHGGSDPGAVSGGLHEADVNLDEAFALAARLADDGIDSTLTRTDDSTKSSRDRYEHCNDANAGLFVSIHTNSVTDSTINGALSIYFHNEDKVLARDLQDAMLAALGPTSDDPDAFIDFGVKKDALGVVLKTDMPGAVAEPVFLSHPDEAARLAQTVAQCSDPANNQCRRAQIVEAIYNGITDYLSAQPDTPTPTATDTPGGDPTPTPDGDFCPPGHQKRGLC